MPTEYERSSRDRILVTARTLFAALGYDNTSTAAVARNAGTSESQLMKHFGGKAGLLEAIFSEGWERINARVTECFRSAGDFAARLSCVPDIVFERLDQDPELKALVFLEAHRMRSMARSNPESSGYARFIGMIDGAIAQGKADGELKGAVAALPLRSAIAGMIEGGVREQVLAERGNFPARYGTGEYSKLLNGFLEAIVAGGRTAGATR